MKLIIAIMPDAHAGKLLGALAQLGFRSTRFQSHGSFLRAGNSTVLLGVDDTSLAEAVDIIRQHCRIQSPGGERGTVAASGATIFVVNVVHYERV